MIMVCDRCGETFEYPEFSISERTQKVENNSICKCITKKNRKIFIYSGCAKSETELNIKGIYQKMASELAWCLGFNENDSKCYEMNGVKNEQI